MLCSQSGVRKWNEVWFWFNIRNADVSKAATVAVQPFATRVWRRKKTLRFFLGGREKESQYFCFSVFVLSPTFGFVWRIFKAAQAGWSLLWRSQEVCPEGTRLPRVAFSGTHTMMSTTRQATERKGCAALDLWGYECRWLELGLKIKGSSAAVSCGSAE